MFPMFAYPTGQMATNDLSDRIRRDVEQGRPRDEIVASLLERGLSQASAERFVDRAIVSQASGGPRPPTAPAVVGKDDEDRATFPWKGVLVAGLVVLGMAGLIGYVKGRPSRRVQRAASAMGVTLTSEESAAVERVLAEAEAQAGKDSQQCLTPQQEEQVERALKFVRTPGASPLAVCDSSIKLGRMGVSRAIPDLQARFADASSPSLQSCAATALANLGEVDGPLAFFVAEIQAPTVEARRGGIMGLGALGPRGAAAALPYLAEALRSPDVMTRYVAVQSLGKLGPAAAPLLRTALDDAEPMVKGEAKDALKAVGGR
jgi:hypothetical protein